MRILISMLILSFTLFSCDTGIILTLGTKVSRPSAATIGTPLIYPANFGTNGIVWNLFTHMAATNWHSYPSVIEIQSDGKIVIGAVLAGADSHILVVRYNLDGSLDTTFNGQGYRVIDDGNSKAVYDIALTEDDEIYVLGTDYDASESFVLKLNNNGSTDTSFGTNGFYTTSALELFSIEMDQAGKIVMAAKDTFDSISAIRMNPDGSLDNTFGVGGIRTIQISPGDTHYLVSQPLEIQADGKLIISVTLNDDIYVLRLTTTGNVDNTFDSDGIAHFNLAQDIATSVKALTNGKILVSGMSNNGLSDGLLLQFNSNGSLDNSFGTGGVVTLDLGQSEQFFDVDVTPSGKIYVGGKWDDGNDTFTLLAKYNANGTPDTSFNTSGNVLHGQATFYSYGHSIGIAGDEYAYITGDTNIFRNNTFDDIGLFRFDNSGTLK